MRRWVLMVTMAIGMAWLTTGCATAQDASTGANMKREFRGAWIQCVNGQFMGMTTAAMQQTLSQQLDELRRDGCNAIIFQVRPECDALYQSDIEPWSYYLTGEQGRAPMPYWDPLAWMIDECHRRGMELHAWINPYRAKTKTAHRNAAGHVVTTHPEWTMRYDGLTLLNPALPGCRDYICSVVADIVSRYDVDGLHIDDYFYPYPVAGVSIDDRAQYMADTGGKTDIGDWRRDNVNRFVHQLSKTIHHIKPWVKFGISPFGIYRNAKSNPDGSRTNGLQNYDDLYADVLLWTERQWVDYCVPQLYWEIGNRAADYAELIGWWNDHCQRTALYIGEDVERTVKFGQQRRKMQMHSEQPAVKGTVLWYAKAAADNIGNYGHELRDNYWRYPALQPTMSHIDHRAPKRPRKVKVVDIDGTRHVLFWTPPRGRSWKDAATAYVVYHFAEGEAVDTDDASHIVAITADTHYDIPTRATGTYVVTALDRMHNESKRVAVRHHN